MGGPGDEFAGVATVGPDEPDPAERGRQAFQQGSSGVAVLDGGGGNGHAQQQAKGVDRDVAFAAVDLLPGVVAAAGLADGFGGFERLGINVPRRRGSRTALAEPCPVAQHVEHDQLKGLLEILRPALALIT